MRMLGLFLAGGLAGAALVWTLQAGRARAPSQARVAQEAHLAPPGPPADSSPREARPPPPPAAPDPGGVPRTVAQPDPTSPKRDLPATSGGASREPGPRHEERSVLIAARTESVRRAAAARGQRAQQRADDAEAVAAQVVDDELSAEAIRLSSVDQDDLLGILRALQRDWVAPVALVASAREFGRHFAARSSGERIGIARINEIPNSLAQGDTIFVPAGRSSLKTRVLTLARADGVFPRDLAFEGEGMDRSLLVLDDGIDISSDVINLAFRDLTVYCDRSEFTSFRAGFTLRLERCRVIGFDKGSGGSTAFHGRLGALYASDSRIEAGFGASPWRGNLWRVSDDFLARLENCTIVGPIGKLGPRGSRSLLVYDHVTFVDLEPREREMLLRDPQAVRLLDCTFEDRQAPSTRASDRRSVTEINPDWAERR